MLKLWHRLDAVLVIYYLDSHGEASLENFMHAFCKANGSPRGIQTSAWERNEHVLDINASFLALGISTLFFIFSHHSRMRWRCLYRSASAALTTSFDAWFFVFFIQCFFLTLFLTSLSYFKADRWRFCFKQPTQKHGYIFLFSFHVYFRNYFRGVSKSCIRLRRLVYI